MAADLSDRLTRMQQLASVVTIVGIVVTFVAYVGEHGVPISALAPKVTVWWRGGVNWTRRRLGLSKSVTIELGAAMASASALSATVTVWSAIQPGDDIAVRVDKLDRNISELRDNMQELRAQDTAHVKATTDRLAKRTDAIEADITARAAKDAETKVRAIRWEFRGLMITLLGAVLGIFA